MKPETVKRWHTTAFRLFWHWRSWPGRPPVSSETQALIRRLSRENPLWGPDRLRDMLLLLGYEAPCAETIRKYMVKPRKPRPPSATWLAFLRNHVEVSWAIDFFTVTTLGFQVLYVFLVLDHARREVRHLAVTARPSMEWVIQQLREAMPFGEQPRYLLPDNDGIFGSGIRRSSGEAPYSPLFAPSALAAMGLRPSVRAAGWDYWGGQRAAGGMVGVRGATRSWLPRPRLCRPSACEE